MNHLTNMFNILTSFRLVELVIISIAIINLTIFNVVNLIKKIKLFLFSKIENNVILQISKVWTFWLLNLYSTLNNKKFDISRFGKFIIKSKSQRKRPLNYLVQMKLIKKILIIKNNYPIISKIKNVITQPFFKNSSMTNIWKKKLIRKSIFFSKTKYSFIRQECKNIVNMTLLINIIYIVLVFSVYMKFKFNFGAIYLIIFSFVLLNYSLFFKIKKIIKLFILNCKKIIFNINVKIN